MWLWELLQNVYKDRDWLPLYSEEEKKELLELFFTWNNSESEKERITQELMVALDELKFSDDLETITRIASRVYTKLTNKILEFKKAAN